MVVLAGWATATAGHDSATNVATPSRNFLAIAGVCTGSLFMLLLHDLVAAG
jgi:hypothetical protein